MTFCCAWKQLVFSNTMPGKLTHSLHIHIYPVLSGPSGTLPPVQVYCRGASLCSPTFPGDSGGLPHPRNLLSGGQDSTSAAGANAEISGSLV